MFELAVELEGVSASVFVLAGSLHEDQFELPGHIVADLDCRCETEGTKVTVMVEALTVEAV